ncbi:MAG TPA: hypothetical protein PLQ93_07370 [Bacteroidia bacterium]|nr:hypothetical protein [Bacteroidia bacterium]
MKKVIVLVAMFGLGLMKGQTLNSKGLYEDNDGALFNGVVSQVQNGTRTELQVKEGVIEGQADYYYASGRLMETGYFHLGQKDRKWTRYAENGNVIAIGFYNLGKKTGTWLVFDEKGHKRFEMNYLDGAKTGIWTNWDEQGEIVSTVDHSKLN